MSESTGSSQQLWSAPTIRDVAAMASTSLKTVSRVVNDEPGVSPELEQRVRQAIARLDYQPNLTASNLRRVGGRTRSVGLLLSNVENPLDNGIQLALEAAALERGLVVISSSIGENAKRERQLVDIFTARRVDGLVMMPAGPDQSYLTDALRQRMSMVFVDRPPAGFDADAVLVDNRAGTARGVAHLIAHGHRRVGYLGALQSIWTAKERVDGYLDALDTALLAGDESLIRLDLSSSDDSYDAVIRMMSAEGPPTALFTAQNMITIGAIRALRDLGLHRTVALVCFDDMMLFDLLEPAITVLAQDPWAIGTLAAATLFDRLDGSNAPPATHVIPVTLIERGSGELPGPFRPSVDQVAAHRSDRLQ
jgi:LacI family transcriptional regulator